MKVSGLLSGGAPVLKKYQVDATVSNAGTPLLVATAGEAGLNAPSTTAINDMVGLTVDTATYATAQGTSSPEALCTLIINPDAIIEARLAPGATSGANLATETVDTASTDGLAVTAGDYNTVDVDEGAIWCISGANVGQVRRITATSTTAATVKVAFANDIAVGDVFCHCNLWPGGLPTPTLTTDLTEFSSQVAAATNTAEMNVIELGARGIGDSYARVTVEDHWLNRGG